MIEGVDQRVLISREDLLTSARLVESRDPDPETELQRLLLVRRFIAASFELSRLIRAQTNCALVNHCGTAGTASLEQATERMYTALEEFAQRCREVAVGGRTSAGSGRSSWQPERAVS